MSDPAQLIRDWITSYDTPTTSVAHLLCDRHHPDTTATTEIGPTLAATTLTFGELAERSHTLAAGLHDLGITPGDRIATLIPKGIDLTVTALAAMHAYHHFGLGVQDDDVYWNTADPGSAYGLYHGVISPLLAGHGSLALRAGFFDPELTLDVLGMYGVTNLAADPTTYRTLRAATKTLPPEVIVQRLSSAGEILGQDVIDWVTDIFGVPVRDHYGQTELGWCAGIPNGPTDNSDTTPATGSLGPPHPRRANTLQEANNDPPPPHGTHGRIAIDLTNSPLAWFDGYTGNESASQLRFTPDHAHYLTGDTGILDRQHQLYFSTRDDGAIVTRGYRIGPSEVEAVLNTHPAVEECGVYSIPDDLAGQLVGARIVLDTQYTESPALAEELKEWVRTRFAEHAAPEKIDFVPELPRTASGKMRRARLR